MTVLAVTDEDFAEKVLASEKPVFIDFWATWCPSCIRFAPTIDAIAEEMPDVTVVKIDIDDAPDVAAKYGIKKIPAMMVFQGGELASTLIGTTPKDDVKAWISNSIAP